MFELLFPLQSPWLQWSDPLPPLPHSDTKLWAIISKTHSVQRGLLFQCALSVCVKECPVTYVTAQPIQQLPPHIHGMPRPDPLTMKQLKIVYLPSVEQLVEYLASIHQMALLPELLVVEDLQRYFPQNGAVDSECHSLARLLAMLKDVQNFLSTRCGYRCPVAVSLVDPKEAFLSVCQRYTDGILSLTDLGADTYSLSETSRPASVLPPAWNPSAAQAFTTAPTVREPCPPVGAHFKAVDNVLRLTELFKIQSPSATQQSSVT